MRDQVIIKKVGAKIKNFNETGYFDVVFDEEMHYP